MSLTNEWTVTHATYMEQLSISRAKTAGRYRTDNSTDGSKPHTPAPMEADCHEFIDTVAVLLTTPWCAGAGSGEGRRRGSEH